MEGDSPGSSCPFSILEKQIYRLLRADLTSDAPSKIQSCLRLFSEHFRCGRQKDVHEFLWYVIDACHSSCLRLKKLRKKGGGGGGGEGGASVVKEIFGGALQSQRFEDILGGKIDKTVGFEEVLVLSSFMCKANQDLKREHVYLRNQVKLALESFAGLGVLKSIQLLGAKMFHRGVNYRTLEELFQISEERQA